MDSDNPNKKPGWQTANSDFYKKYKDEREKLKNEMTKAENMLWEKLRNKQLGVKFRRQHSIDFYIPDFVALSIKLIIEVDGKIHLFKKAEDNERTKRLAAVGYRVVRFTNEEVENDIEEVVLNIKNEVDKLTPPSLPKGGGIGFLASRMVSNFYSPAKSPLWGFRGQNGY